MLFFLLESLNLESWVNSRHPLSHCCAIFLCYSLFHLVRSTIGTLLPPSPFSGQILNHAMWLASNDNSPDHAGRGKNLKILHSNNIHELCHDGGLALEDAGGLSRPDWSKVFIRGERE